MAGGFRNVLIGVFIIIVIFGVLSLQPLLLNGTLRFPKVDVSKLWHPGQPNPPATAPAPQPISPPPPPPSQPPAIGTTPPPAPTITVPPPPSPPPPQHSLIPGNATSPYHPGTLAPPQAPPPPPSDGKEQAGTRYWLYTQRAVVMHVAPRGRPFVPISVSGAPLVLLAGTRVWQMKREGDWALVRSPSKALGWVYAVDLGKEDVPTGTLEGLDSWEIWRRTHMASAPPSSSTVGAGN